jgi:hypothetical protein
MGKNQSKPIGKDADLRGWLDLDELYRHPEKHSDRCVSCEAAQVAVHAVDEIIDVMDDIKGQEELALVHTAAECFKTVLNHYHGAGMPAVDMWPMLVENLRLLISIDDYPLRKLDPSININPADQFPEANDGMVRVIMTADDVTAAMLEIQNRNAFM